MSSSSSSIIMPPPHEETSTAAVAPPSDAPLIIASSSASPPILTSLLSNVVAPPALLPVATAAPPSLFNDDAATLEVESAPLDDHHAPTEEAVLPHRAGASSDSGVTGSGDRSTSPSQQLSSRSGIADYYSSSQDIFPPAEAEEEEATTTPLNSSEEGGVTMAVPSSRRYPSRERRNTTAASADAAEVESNQEDDLSTHLNPLIENGIIVSMKDPNYKAIMFSFFRKLGAVSRDKRDGNEETRVKEEAFNFFKNYSGGRFMNYVNYRSTKDGIVEVDEKTARIKISNDIYRRLESASHWAGENSPSDIILSLRDDNYRQVMYTAFRELGTDNDNDDDAENRVKDATFAFLKGSGGRFMRYRDGKRPDKGLITVDEKTARNRIAADISRRFERKHLWNGLDLSNANDISVPLQEKEATVEEEGQEEASLGSNDDDGSDYEEDSKSPLSVQTSGNDIILSMRNDNYKSIMFSFFQRLGALPIAQRDSDEEKRVKNEAYSMFKSKIERSGGRLMGYINGRRPEDGLIEVDEKTARNKISMDITRRLTSESYWADKDASDPRRGIASEKSNPFKKVKKEAALKGVGRSKSPREDKIVSIRKFVTKYSPPTKRVSSYPKRSNARVTFKDDEQYSVPKTSVAMRASRSSTRGSELHSEVDEALYLVSDVAISAAETTSRDYKCGVCGQPKKGHVCHGDPSSWEESSIAVAKTPARARSKSQPGLSAKSPKTITPTPKREYSLSDSAVATLDRVHRVRQACRACENCLREDCGECAMCEDMIKFGGRGTKRQKCLERRCLGSESRPARTTNTDKLQLTLTPKKSTRSGTKRKAAVAANFTIMNIMADDDLENKIPLGCLADSAKEVAESQLFVNRAKFASEEEEIPSFEEISALEFNELIDLLQSSPLPQRKVPSTELDWQGLHLADLSPIPVVPTTRVVTLDTSKPIILGPNSSWSQRLIMTEEECTTSSPVRGRTLSLRSNHRMPIMEPKTSESQQFESIMSPSFGDGYTSIFSEDHKLIPYSPINLLPRHSSPF